MLKCLSAFQKMPRPVLDFMRAAGIGRAGSAYASFMLATGPMVEEVVRNVTFVHTEVVRCLASSSILDLETNDLPIDMIMGYSGFADNIVIYK